MTQNHNDAEAKTELKVELDLDDAPFLKDDIEEEKSVEPEAPEMPAPALQPAVEVTGSITKKRVMIIGGGAGALLIIILVCFYLFSGSKEEPMPPAPTPVVEDTPAPPASVAEEYVMDWEPFWVEVKDTEGSIRFLTLKFSVPTKSPNVFSEMNVKKLILRDALFYYLRNQPILSLSDEASANALKSDLLTVINEHLASGKASEIFIESYLLQK